MNGKIIEFNTELQKRLASKIKENQLTIEDIFNLLLIYKHNEGLLTSFNLDLIERAFARYKHIERFSMIFSNIVTQHNKTMKKL